MKRKTRIERVYNEDTGWFETREVELNSYSFTDDDRIMIVREYMESGLPAEEIIKKYYISSRTVLFSWMDKFLNEKDLLSLPPEDQNRDDMAKTTNEQLKEKDAEIKRLRKALELEKLRSKAFSTMIDLAEETFNIPVRKKIWYQTVSLLRTECQSQGLGTLCGLFGFTRQAYNKRNVSDGFAEEAIESIIIEKAREYRKSNPGLGAAKLHVILKQMFEDTGCFPGRDAFIEMLRKHGLMVRIKRRRRYKTTDSDHNYRKYPNLIKGVVPTHPNQIWASDITYVETNEGVCYLSLITDLYSHKIVGWAVGPTLETVYPLEALKMAYKSIDEETAKGLIHHSDRGSQYCSQNYVSILKSHGSQISMTQTGDPLENAIAERANGILKTEWLYRMTIPTRKVCKKELTRIIAFYNDERPHMSIGNQTPSVAHTQAGPQQKMWKNPWENSSN